MKKQLYIASLVSIVVFGQDAWSERMALANRLQEQGRYRKRVSYIKAQWRTRKNPAARTFVMRKR